MYNIKDHNRLFKQSETWEIELSRYLFEGFFNLGMIRKVSKENKNSEKVFLLHRERFQKNKKIDLSTHLPIDCSITVKVMTVRYEKLTDIKEWCELVNEYMLFDLKQIQKEDQISKIRFMDNINEKYKRGQLIETNDLLIWQSNKIMSNDIPFIIIDDRSEDLKIASNIFNQTWSDRMARII